jgi:hypothetical protein
MRILLSLVLLTQVACSQVLIGVKAPKATTTATLPGVPVLIAPANLATSVPVSTTLSWNPVDSVDTYTVNISTVSSFATTVVNWTTQYTSIAVYNLDSGTVYYWRVRASNLAGNSAWATYRQFTTVTGSAPGTPIISSPLAGADSVEIDPLLSWTAVAATSYKVQVSLSSSFIPAFIDTNITSTSLQLDTLSYNTTYYWRVRGSNSWGIGSYASASFTTTPLISRVRPAPVSTLAAYDTDTNKIFLRWNTVGNDSLTGRAASYDIRYSTVNITESNWPSVTQATGEPTPRTTGSLDSVTISGLTSNTQYYFALKVSDDTTGVSSLSNVATAKTDTVPTTPLGPGYPNAVTTLAVDSTNTSTLFLAWTATGDDADIGTATTYDVRYSTRIPSTGELIANGTFDANVNGWSLLNSGGALAWSASGGRISGGALKLTHTDSYCGVVYPVSNTASDSATVSMYIYATYRDTIDFGVLDQNDQILGGSSRKYLQAGMWNYVTRTVPLNGLQTSIKAWFNFDPGVSSNILYVDDASMTVGVSWASLTQATGEPAPHISGTLEHFSLTGLSNNTKYYTALKVIDDSSNTSGISNIVSGTTRSVPPPPDTTSVDTVKIYAGDYHVKVGGNDALAGTSYATAWASISKANSTASAGDTVVIYSGSYSGSLAPSRSGTATQPIVFSAYGSDVVTITGDASANDGNSMNLSQNYINVERIRFIDAARASTASMWFWGLIGGSHNTLNRVQFLDDQDTSAYITGGKNGRLLYAYGKYTTIKRSRFRGGSEGIVIDGAAPRYYLLDHDTITWSGYNNLILGGGGATVGVYHAGLVQYCVLDTAFEDNVQIQNNGNATQRCNSGIIVRNSFFGNAGENAFDMKATGSTVTIEDNIIVNSFGNDTNEKNGGVANDNAGAGIDLGAFDVAAYGIIRGNIIQGNHTGSKMLPGYHIYQNTFSNNSHSYRGFNSTSSTYAGLATDNVMEAGEWKRLINNIFYDESGASNRVHLEIIKANASYLEINNNLYYQSGGSPEFVTNYPDPWPTNTTYTGLSAWKTALTGSAFSGWVGRDAQSVSEDPLFVNVPANPGAYSDTMDFNIGASSPAKSTAKTLTVATNTGTNSTSLSVSDPYYFRTDYGIPSFYSGVKGDSIQIGSAAAVEITAINYSTGELTLSGQRTWSNGASVWLWKDGRQVNDIGAKQRD